MSTKPFQPRIVLNPGWGYLGLKLKLYNAEGNWTSFQQQEEEQQQQEEGQLCALKYFSNTAGKIETLQMKLLVT